MGSERTSLLVDFGIAPTRVSDALTEIGGPPVRDVLLTHTHSDHFRYVPDAVKRGAFLHIPRVLRRSVGEKAGSAIDDFCGDTDIGDIIVSPFPVSHDVPCFGFSFYSEGSKVSVVTDLGVMPRSTLESLADADAVLIESNYDEELLRANTKYPAYLKARIASPRGHLSNTDSAACVAYLAECGVKHIILGHLSEENNTPALALEAAEHALAARGVSGRTSLTVAGQNTRSEVIEV